MRVVALAASLAAGCCFAPTDWPSIDLGGPAVELGTAVFPAGTSEQSTRRQVWSAPSLTPSHYAVGYALSAAEDTANDHAYHAWASSIGYRQMGPNVFASRPQPGCENGLVCAQRFLATHERQDIQPLATRFSERAHASGMNTVQLASLILGFVQAIEYRLPTTEPFGVLGPALVASRGWGDCDSKSLLGVVLMQEVGIDAVLLSSQAHRHGAVGIHVPATGTTFQYQGSTYAYGESTVRGWPIGRAPPQMMTPPHDWTVAPVWRAAPASAPAPRGSRPHHRSRPQH